MRATIKGYQEAIRIIQDIFASRITEDEVQDIILKIAEQNPSALVKARNSLLGTGLGMGRKVIGHLREGKRILAIKAYRETTGVGLKEAKDAIDAIERKFKGTPDADLRL